MTSEIKVDTISEQTSANGVVIDSVTLKDGAIGATGTATSVAGITFYRGDGNNTSIYTHDVSGTDSTAQYNASYGITAMDAITTGDYNTAFGYGALGAATSGNTCAAFGYGALQSNTVGDRLVAIGTNAFQSLNPDSNADMESTAVGHSAGEACTTGDYNTFIGAYAGAAVTTGAQNTLVGRYAGGGFDTENHNLAIGRNALGGSVAGGEYNVGIGNFTLDAVTSGDNNTCVGNSAGSALTTGSNNISIGHNSAFSSTNSSYAYVIGTNCESAGTGGYVTIGSDAGGIRIYNDFDVNATWTRVSDIRYKENIKPNTDCGLDFINDLNPVTFTWKAKADIDKSLPDYDETNLEPTHDKKMYGLIAQEVKAALDKHNITDFGGHNIIEKSGIQSIAQSMFIYPLIKAVQELSAKVKELESK